MVSYLVGSTPPGNVLVSTSLRFIQRSRAAKSGGNALVITGGHRVTLGGMTRRHEHPIDRAASEVAGALFPGLGLISGRLAGAVRTEWERNASSALRAAERSSGRSREDLEELITADPDVLPLYMHVLWAAGMNGHDVTLRAMGTALGSAARARIGGDQDAFDTAEDALRAMREFTPRQFKALRHLDGYVSPPARKGDIGVFPKAYAKVSGMSIERSNATLASLAAAGLADAQSNFLGGQPGYKITAIGSAILRASGTIESEGDCQCPSGP